MGIVMAFEEFVSEINQRLIIEQLTPGDLGLSVEELNDAIEDAWAEGLSTAEAYVDIIHEGLNK